MWSDCAAVCVPFFLFHSISILDNITNLLYFFLDTIAILLYIMTMKPKEIIKILEANGWSLKRIRGSHHIMTKPGFRSVPVPIHDNGDMNPDYVKDLEKQTGVKLL